MALYTTCVNSVSVYPKSITLKKGNWYYDAYAEVCPCDADCNGVVWHSDNPSVASVNASSGYIYANSAGSAKIYATATDGSGSSDYITVTVKEIVKVTSVSLNRSSLLIEKGKYRTLTATVLPTNAENKALIWRSDKPCFASVCNGIVYAVAKGTATITATATDGSGKYAACTVSVTEDVLVTSVSVTSIPSLRVGDSYYLSATVLPTNATNKAVLWTSDNTEVAGVNADSGLVYANGVGTAKITATARDGSGVYGTINISVSPVPVTSVTVSPKEKTLSVGETTTLNATVSPSNATDKSVIWTSSDTSVATVGKYTGIVTAKSVGVATITASSKNGNQIYDTCTIWCDKYLYELVNQCSFSESAAILIRTIYDKVNNIYTSETELQKAWRCARLLSEFSYDDFKFNDVAGSLTNQESRKSYFMNTLGYTEDEYNTLRIALPDNHDNGDAIDFTHLQYSLAARLAYTLNKHGWVSNLGSQFKTGNWGIYSDEDISYLGGWLGDATLRNYGGTGVPILKNDDYMSDLDAENVYRLLLQGYASVDALNVYYSTMNSSNTRAEIFLQYIPYSTVKQKIFYELIDAQLYMFLSNASSQGDIYMTQYWLNLINNEQYHFDEIKSKYSDTYDFLMSLNDRLLTLAHYQ